MIRNSDIIMFCLSRWDAPISSPAFSLAKEFSKNNRVFYIDHPFSLKDFFQKLETPQVKNRKDALLWGRNMYTKPEGLSESLTIVTPKLTLPINFLPDGLLYQKLSKQNDRIVFNAIRQVIRDYDIKDFIFFNAFNPFFCREFPADIKPAKKIYQSMDDMTQADYTRRHGARLEEDIIRKFDITLTTSKELRRLKSRFSDHVYYHPNAADFSIFEKAMTEKYPMPPELAAAKGRKIIGFTGNIEGRTDYQLIKKILDFHTDKVLAMVGPVTTEEHKTIGLTDHPNVIMVGPRKITELPQYLQHFDCALIPFKKNLLTKSIYPLKINEYLAAGRPVIATDFSEDIKTFREVAYIGRDHDEFVSLIDKAIYENDDQKISQRREVANQNTWAARVETFWQILEENMVPATRVATASAA
jgi:glycosyltransferase involved in cell wall biosynthesis